MFKKVLHLGVVGLLVFSTVLPQQAFAWSSEGHRAIAIIASQRLQGTATAKRISALLGPVKLADIALCPDELRELERHQITHLTPACAAIFPAPPAGTANWHFVDIPVKPAPFQPSDADIDTACANNCVLTQIDKFLAVLAAAKPKDSKKKKLQQKQALSFIVHFIGDVHQPLHSADRDGDHGGNAEHVSFFGSDQSHKLALHTIWDNQIVTRVDGSETQLVADLHDEILAAANEPLVKPRDWAVQAYGFARDVSYKDIPAPNQDPGVDIADLGQPYQDTAAPVVRQQIARAGVRLAAALQSAFK